MPGSWICSSTAPSPLPPEAAPADRRRLIVLFTAALAVTAAAVTWQQERQGDPHVAYGRFVLPGFDAHVYMAMAERPAVFTVAPWGHRVLIPAVIHAMGLRSVVRGFRLLSFGALAVAGGLLFLFLRRRRFSEAAALAGVALFALTPPMARVVETPFFLEPVGILLVIALLLAIESGAGWGTLALLATLATLAKDGVIVLSLVPAVLVARWSVGPSHALRPALAAALPALLLTPALRWWWTPHIPVVAAPWDAEMVRAAYLTLRQVWEPTALAALAGGLVPLALLGAPTPAGRAHLRRYGLSLSLLYAMAFFAWLKVPSREPVPLFGANFERLLIYSVPLLLPLALAAIGRLAPAVLRADPAVTEASRAPRRQWIPAAAALAVIAATFASVDRYRRVDLQGSRDGPLVLAVCRETWRTAARLDAGEEVVLDPATRRFAWGESDPAQLGRMRWFLREGWGARAHYGTNEVVMHEAAAVVLLPVLRPVDLELRLRMMAPFAETLTLAVNGQPLGSWHADTTAPEQAFRVPARLLFRGDNVVTITSPEQGGGARLREIRYRLLTPS